MIRLCSIVLVGFLLAILGGCTAPPISSTQELTGKEGAVIFKLITNGQGDFEAIETLVSVTLNRERSPTDHPDARNEVTLLRTRTSTHTTAVFSGMVPPGRYTVIRATGGLSGNQPYIFPLEKALSPFDVRAQEVSLLGTLMVHPLPYLQFSLAYLPPDPEIRETFADLFPSMATQMNGNPIHTLEVTPEIQRRMALAPQFKRMTTAVNALMQTSKGEFFAGSKLGKAKWRKPGETRWRDLDVGSWREVLSLRAYRQGLVAAGEEGLLRFSPDEGKTWRPLTPPDKGAIYAMEPLANGKVCAASRYQTRWSTYVSDDLMSGAWRKIGTFEDEGSFNSGHLRQRPVVVMKNSVGVMMPNGAFHVTNCDTGEITRLTSGNTTLGLSASPDGTLTQRVSKFSLGYAISQDDGRTWTDLNVNRFTTAVAFKNRQTVYALTAVSPGVTAGDYAVMKSNDTGQTWSTTGLPPSTTPAATLSMHVDRFDDSLVAFMRDGSSLRSRDEGRTWVKEL